MPRWHRTRFDFPQTANAGISSNVNENPDDVSCRIDIEIPMSSSNLRYIGSQTLSTDRIYP